MKLKKTNPRIIGIVTVRTSSRRFPNKCFMDLNGITVIEHIILRCLVGGIEPIVCTTINSKDNKLIDVAKKLKIKYFRGPEKNKLLRWYKCCRKFKINYFHTIDADDIFFDWEAVKKSYKKLLSQKKDIIVPSKISRLGGASEGYSINIKFLQKILRNKKLLRKKNFDTEMIEPFIDKKSKVGSFKGSNYELKNARLTLDYLEDYKLLKKISRSCGSYNHRKNINSYLKKNIKLLKINNFRNEHWQKQQKKIIKKIQYATK